MEPLELWYPLDQFVIAQRFGENPDYYLRNYKIAGHNGWDMIGHTVGVSRDNRWITYTETATEGDLWMVTLR